MSGFKIKRNDTSPSLLTQLLDPNGAAQNITGASSVKLFMRIKGDETPSGVVIDEDVTVVDALNGLVRYDWAPEDTATEGEFEAEVQVTYATGEVETFPNDSYGQVTIFKDIK